MMERNIILKKDSFIDFSFEYQKDTKTGEISQQ